MSHAIMYLIYYFLLRNNKTSHASCHLEKLVPGFSWSCERKKAALRDIYHIILSCDGFQICGLRGTNGPVRVTW